MAPLDEGGDMELRKHQVAVGVPGQAYVIRHPARLGRHQPGRRRAEQRLSRAEDGPGARQ